MKKVSPLLILVFIIACLGCSRKERNAETSYLLPPAYKVVVAPFTQPVVGSDLIAGNIPENQGKITGTQLEMLNRDLRSVLSSQSHRSFTFLSEKNLPVSASPVSAQSGGIKKWLDYGINHNFEFILIPQVLDWHDREGSEAGVTSSASVKLEFFLVDVKNQTLNSRFTYDEKQVGLIDNILTVGDFMKRKGRWVDANTLAKEGMEKAVRELGL